MSLALNAQSLSYAFKHLGIDNGLSQSTAYDLIQDDSGILWIATQEGLNRFDGKSIEVFYSQYDEENSLPNNYIRSLARTNNHSLWVGTLDGLAKMDLTNNKVVRYKISKRSMDNHVNDLMLDSNERLWIATKSGVFYKDREDEFVKVSLLITRGLANKKEEIEPQAFKIVKGPAGAIWIATNKGLFWLDPKNNNLLNISLKSEVEDKVKPVAVLKFAVFDLVFDHEGILWLGTEKGLIRLDLIEFNQTIGSDISIPIVENSIKQTLYRHDQTNLDSLSSNEAYRLLLDRSNQLWVGTDTGLNRLKLNEWKQGRFALIKHELSDTNSLSSGNIYSLTQDRQSNIWVGTTTGLSYFNPEQQKFTSIKYRADTAGLAANNVFGMTEDKKGHVWVGTTAGASEFDKNWKWIRTLSEDNHVEPTAPSLSDDSVYDIAIAENGDVWFATGNGLDRFHKKTGLMMHYQYDESNNKSLSENLVFTLLFDTNGDLWVGTADGLNKFNKKTNLFTRFYKDDNNLNSLSDNEIYSLYQDILGNLWVGTLRGLNKIELSSGQVTRFTKGNKDLINDWVFAMTEIDDKGLWVATYGGLTHLDPKTMTSRFYDVSDGLPSNALYAVVSDERGRLWMSSNKGITRFDPDNKKFKNFDVMDGLQALEFNFESYLTRRNGEMVFGGINGLTRLNSNEMSDSLGLPVPVFSKLYINHKRQNITDESVINSNINHLKRLNLEPKHKSIILEFSNDLFQSLDDVKYRYKLQGYDKTWQYLAKGIAQVQYSEFPAGIYSFMLQASVDGINWSVNRSIIIDKKIVFYRTIWFYSLLILFFIGSFVLILYVKSNIEKDRRDLLENLVKRKTARLSEKTEKLSQSEHTLQKYAADLALSKKEVEEKNQELMQGNEDRSLFYQSIAHELGNAATVFKGYQYALEQGNKINLIPILKQTFDYTLKLKNIAELSDYKEFNYVWVDLTEIVNQIINRAQLSAVQSEISLSVKIGVDLALLASPDALSDVLTNLIGNAIKYTPAGGSVSLEFEYKGTCLDIKIRDTGIGISPESYETIFKYGSRLQSSITDAKPGSGLGLMLVKRYCDAHGWAINLESELGKGTCFRLKIPEIQLKILTGGSSSISSKSTVAPEVTSSEYHRSKDQFPDFIIKNTILPPLEMTNKLEYVKANNNVSILIVEDEPMVRDALLYMLEGYECRVADNGIEGLKMAKKYMPKIILTDLNMPELDGVSMTQQLKQDDDTNYIPIIQMTAFHSSENKQYAWQYGADEYLTKPLDTRVLRLKINSILDNQERLIRRFMSIDASSGSSHKQTKSNIQNDFSKNLKHYFDKWFELGFNNQSELNKGPSLEQVSNAFGMAPRTFQTHVKNETGQSYKQLFIEFRNTKSEFLLRKGYSALDVCFICGFSEESVLNKAMKRFIDKTPGEIKRESERLV